jgi:hypothetical protein
MNEIQDYFSILLYLFIENSGLHTVLVTRSIVQQIHSDSYVRSFEVGLIVVVVAGVNIKNSLYLKIATIVE